MLKRVLVLLVLLGVFVGAPAISPTSHTALAVQNCQCVGSIDLYDESWGYIGNLPNGQWFEDPGNWGYCQGTCGDWVFAWGQQVCNVHSPTYISINWQWYYQYFLWGDIGPQNYACSDIT